MYKSTMKIDTHNNDVSQPNHMKSHFFASCALGWATAPTRDEAIKKLAQANYHDFKYSIDSLRKKGEIGTYVWSCEVMTSEDTKYSIEFYAPQGVPKANGEHHFVTYITRKAVAWHTQEEI